MSLRHQHLCNLFCRILSSIIQRLIYATALTINDSSCWANEKSLNSDLTTAQFLISVHISTSLCKKHFSINLNYWDLFKLQQLEEIEIIINRKTFFSCTERRFNLINELFCSCCIMICRIFPFHISLHICKCALTILRNRFLKVSAVAAS